MQATQETGLQSLVWEGVHWSTPVYLPGKFHGQRSLAGYSPWGHKESDMADSHACKSKTSLFLLFEIRYPCKQRCYQVLLSVLMLWGPSEILRRISKRTLHFFFFFLFRYSFASPRPGDTNQRNTHPLLLQSWLSSLLVSQHLPLFKDPLGLKSGPNPRLQKQLLCPVSGTFWVPHRCIGVSGNLLLSIIRAIKYFLSALILDRHRSTMRNTQCGFFSAFTSSPKLGAKYKVSFHTWPDIKWHKQLKRLWGIMWIPWRWMSEFATNCVKFSIALQEEHFQNKEHLYWGLAGRVYYCWWSLFCFVLLICGSLYTSSLLKRPFLTSVYLPK